MVNAGGLLVVLSGGTASGTQPSDTPIVSSGVVLLEPGSAVATFPTVAPGVTVSNGGSELVLPAGEALGTTVDGGGQQLLFGGTASDTTLAGGRQQVNRGITVFSTTIDNGGFEIVSQGGVASNTVVSYGGSATFVAGSASFLVVSNGGSALVEDPAMATSTTISAGGREMVTDGALDVSGTVKAGGSQTVGFFSLASNTVVRGGGTQILTQYGEAGTSRWQRRRSVRFGRHGAAATVLGGGDSTCCPEAPRAAPRLTTAAWNGVLRRPGRQRDGEQRRHRTVVRGRGHQRHLVAIGGTMDVAYLQFVSGGVPSATSAGVLTVRRAARPIRSNWPDLTPARVLSGPGPGGGTVITAEEAPVTAAAPGS